MHARRGPQQQMISTWLVLLRAVSRPTVWRFPFLNREKDTRKHKLVVVTLGESLVRRPCRRERHFPSFLHKIFHVGIGAPDVGGPRSILHGFTRALRLPKLTQISTSTSHEPQAEPAGRGQIV